MVIKPKLYLNLTILLSFFGVEEYLFAQSKISEPIFQTLNGDNTKDILVTSSEPQLVPDKMPTVQVKGNLPQELKLKPILMHNSDEKSENKTLELEKAGSFTNQFIGVPSAFISLGNRQPTYGIVVEKNIHRLSVFKLQDDGNYSVVKTYKAITGKEKGDKKYSGDNRTPEGIYFVVGQKQSSELFRRWGKSASKYGPLAFVLDYPNIFDKRLHKSGFGIWIHGVKNEARILTPFDTEGCVALTNSDVLDISHYISPFETPVVIVDEMQSSSMTNIQDEREKVLSMLETWRKSWEDSDIKTYTEFYSDNFYSLGKTKEQWENFKKLLATRRDNSIKVQISEPKILAFKNQLLVEFLQKYTSKEKVDFGRKFLYLHQEGDQFKIIAEKWYSIKDHVDLELAVLSRNKADISNNQAEKN